jgi:hypothetical protein
LPTRPVDAEAGTLSEVRTSRRGLVEQQVHRRDLAIPVEDGLCARQPVRGVVRVGLGIVRRVIRGECEGKGSQGLEPRGSDVLGDQRRGWHSPSRHRTMSFGKPRQRRVHCVVFSRSGPDVRPHRGALALTFARESPTSS